MTYLLAILFLAMDSFYYLFSGIMPAGLLLQLDSGISLIQKGSHIAGYPVEYLMNILLTFTPKAFREFLPVTNTEILGARIAWVPILSLLIYTSILKSFSDYILNSKVTNIQKKYSKNDKDN